MTDTRLFDWRSALIVSVVLKSVFFGLTLHYGTEHPYMGRDSYRYVDLALSLLEDQVFQLDLAGGGPSVPETIRTPGFPILVACVFKLFGESTLTFVSLQFLASLMLIPMAHRIAINLTGKTGIGNICAWLVALNMNIYEFSVLMLTEISTVMFLALVLLQLTREKLDWKNALIAGLAGGFCTLIRPSSVLLVYAAVLFILMAKRDWRTRILHTAVFLIAVNCVLTPWKFRNKHHFGHFQLSSMKGYGAYLAWHGRIEMHRRGLSWNEYFSTPELDEIKRAILNSDRAMARSQALFETAVNTVRSEPVLFLKFVLLEGCFRLYANSGTYLERTLYDGADPDRKLALADRVHRPRANIVQAALLANGLSYGLLAAGLVGFPFLAWSGKLGGRVVLAILSLMTFTAAIVNWRIAVWVVALWMAAAMIEVVRSSRLRAGTVPPHFTAKFWPVMAMIAVFTLTHSNTFGCNRYRVIIELPLALLSAVAWHHLIVRPGNGR